MSSDENGRRDPQHLFVGSSTLIARRSLPKSVSFVLFNLTVFVRRLSRASLAASAVAGAHIVLDVVDVCCCFYISRCCCCCCFITAVLVDVVAVAAANVFCSSFRSHGCCRRT